MRQRLEELRAEHLIDEGCVCPVALQGDRADLRDSAGREAIAVAAVMGITTGVRACAVVRTRQAWPETAEYNPTQAEEGGRGGGPLSPGSLMTAPRPTPCR